MTETEAYAHMIESFQFLLLPGSATPTPLPPPGLIHPIVVYPPYDSPSGYLPGGTQNRMWLDSNATAMLLKGGDSMVFIPIKPSYTPAPGAHLPKILLFVLRYKQSHWIQNHRLHPSSRSAETGMPYRASHRNYPPRTIPIDR